MGDRSTARAGRPPVTSRAALERTALALFTARGFDDTTVEDIAGAAGIGRRTFFRYYASKNDVLWGDFAAGLARMEAWLDAAGVGPLVPALAEVVVRFNALEPGAVPAHRQRMALILQVPTLQAHSTLRYAEWRAVVVRFAARRLGQAGTDLLPQLIGHAALACAVTAYEQWLVDPAGDLAALLHEAFAHLDAGLAGPQEKPVLAKSEDVHLS